MADMIISRELLLNALANELTSIVDSATVHLSSDTTPFTSTTTAVAVLAHEPTYPGYLPQEWDLTPIALQGNEYEVVQGTLVFGPPSSGPSVTLYGYAVLYTGPDGHVYTLGGNQFNAPIVIGTGSASLAILLNLSDLDLNAP